MPYLVNVECKYYYIQSNYRYLSNKTFTYLMFTYKFHLNTHIIGYLVYLGKHTTFIRHIAIPNMTIYKVDVRIKRYYLALFL